MFLGSWVKTKIEQVRKKNNNGSIIYHLNPLTRQYVFRSSESDTLVGVNCYSDLCFSGSPPLYFGGAELTGDVFCLPSVPLGLPLRPKDNPLGLGDCCGWIVVVEVLWPTHVDRVVHPGRHHSCCPCLATAGRSHAK